MKKVTLSIAGKSYDISIEDEFASVFEKEIEETFKNHGKSDIKTLLRAYVKKSYENYLLEKKIEKIEHKISDFAN